LPTPEPQPFYGELLETPLEKMVKVFLKKFRDGFTELIRRIKREGLHGYDDVQ
jgi:hypothetical protein